MHNMRQSTRDSSNGTVYTEFFWHNLTKHGSVFRAVASITQLAIENGEPLFDVEYNGITHFEEL